VASRIMIAAAEEGRPDVVAYAIERGAAVDMAEPEHGRTALMLAADHNDLDTMAILIANRADIEARSADGWTPLIHAAAAGAADAVRFLIEAGADTEKTEDAYGFTAVMIAALLGKVDAVAALADGGADIDARGGPTGATPLILAAGSRDAAAPLVVAELIVRGARPNLSRSDGATPLMVAAGAGNADVVRLLLDEGADPDLRARDGQTARDAAAQAGHTAIVALLGGA
jgi:ankyrin repeat protein